MVKYGKVYSRGYVRCAIVTALTLGGLIVVVVAAILIDDMAQAVHS